MYFRRHYEGVICEHLEETLLPFIEEVYPEGHKFMMDSDPKHTSGYVADWMREKISQLVENPYRVPRSQSY